MDSYENIKTSIEPDTTPDSASSDAPDDEAQSRTEPIIIDEKAEFEAASDLISDNSDSAKAFKAKTKSRVIMPSITVAFCIILISVFCVAAYFIFFNTNVKGVWIVDDDNVNTVLCFKENGVVEMTIGSITIKGDYEIIESNPDNVAQSTSSKNDEKRINITIVYGTTSFLYGNFAYQVTGNAFTGRTLKLTDDSNNSLTMKSGKKESIVKPDAERKYTKALVGVWENENMTYTFTEDGYMYLDYNYISFECSYSDDGKKIYARYFTPEELNIEIDFAFQEENTVEIDGLVFTRKK